MTMQLVPIFNAILHAKEETDVNTGIGDQMLHRWAKKAEAEIGLQRIHRRLKVITLESNYLEPPADAIKIKYVYDGDVTDLLQKSSSDVEESTLDDDDGAIEGYVWAPLTEEYVGENMWDIQGQQIIFDTSKVGQTITLDYSAFPVNDNDDIMVPEFHLDAISLYVQYRMARALRWKMMRDPKMMRSNEIYAIREMKKEWRDERAVAKAKSAEMTPFDKYKIDAALAEMTGSFIYNFEDDNYA